MGKITFAAVIYERFKDKDGNYPVKLRVTYKQEPRFYATKIVATPNQLKLSSREKNIPVKDNRLNIAINSMLQHYKDAASLFDPDSFPDWTHKDIKSYLDKAIQKKKGFRLDFPKFFDEFIEEKKRTSIGAANNYRSALRSLNNFMKGEHYDISMLTSRTMRAYEDWLRNQYGPGARAVSLYTSAVMTVHKAARDMYNTEELEELNIKDLSPFYKAPKQPAGHHRDVDPAIVQQMIKDYSKLKGRERLGVGCFIMGFALLGINTPDLYFSETPKNGIIIYNRTKTRARRADNAEMHVKIPECIQALVSEYADSGKKAPSKDKSFSSKTGRLYSFHRRYSAYKDLGRAINIGLAEYKKRIELPEDAELTYYCCRHTWSTIARSSKCNIGLDVIDGGLNHVSMYREGDRYARPDYSVYWEANEKVLATLDWTAIQAL